MAVALPHPCEMELPDRGVLPQLGFLKDHLQRGHFHFNIPHRGKMTGNIPKDGGFSGAQFLAQWLAAQLVERPQPLQMPARIVHGFLPAICSSQRTDADSHRIEFIVNDAMPSAGHGFLAFEAKGHGAERANGGLRARQATNAGCWSLPCFSLYNSRLRTY